MNEMGNQQATRLALAFHAQGRVTFLSGSEQLHEVVCACERVGLAASPRLVAEEYGGSLGFNVVAVEVEDHPVKVSAAVAELVEEFIVVWSWVSVDGGWVRVERDSGRGWAVAASVYFEGDPAGWVFGEQADLRAGLATLAAIGGEPQAVCYSLDGTLGSFSVDGGMLSLLEQALEDRGYMVPKWAWVAPEA
jgi:hypothetical protein